MGKVYIVCEPSKKVDGESVRSMDLTPAADWGEVVVLLPNAQSMFLPVQTIASLKIKLASFCDDDFLVPVGDPALMCAAAIVAAGCNSGRIRLLKWDRHLSKYFPISLTI